jgi:hypothetical protein
MNTSRERLIGIQDHGHPRPSSSLRLEHRLTYSIVLSACCIILYQSCYLHNVTFLNLVCTFPEPGVQFSQYIHTAIV